MKTKAEHSRGIYGMLKKVENLHREMGITIARLHGSAADMVRDHPDDIDPDIVALAAAPKDEPK